MIQDNGQSPTLSLAKSRSIGFRFGVFELDIEAGELRKDGRLTRIRNQPLKVLAILLARPGTLVTREDLYKELWHAEEIVDFDQGLNHSIREIRAILGDNADSPRFVQTLPRRGYRFLAEVRPLMSVESSEQAAVRAPIGPDLAQDALLSVANETATGDQPPPGVAASPSLDSQPSLELQTRRRPHLTVGLVVVAAIGLAVSAWLVRLPTGGSQTPTSKAARLLVLPFAAASGSADDELVADGLTDEVISRVGRARPQTLTVLGRTSSMEYKGRPAPLSELKRSMDVTYVLEGRVQRTPHGTRAIASLVQAADGARVWALDDKSHADLWSFQESVSEQIARGIDGAVALPRLADRRSPKSLDANLSYLRGRALLVNRDSESLRQALASFERCVRDEPTFAPAWASIAETRVILMDHGLIDPALNWPAVKAAADRSVTLDPNLAEGWSALAAYHSINGANEDEARRSLERALTLNPNLVVAHHWNSVRLTAVGRYQEAETAIRRAISLDPLAPVLHGNLGGILSSLGRHAEALREFEIVLDLKPDWPLAHVWMGRALGRAGRWSEAILTFERGAKDADGAARAYLVAALARSGNTARARTILAEMKDPNRPYTAPYYRALASFSLGDRDAAITDLRKTITEGSPLTRNIALTEDWKGFETDPRFRRLVELVAAPTRNRGRERTVLAK